MLKIIFYSLTTFLLVSCGSIAIRDENSFIPTMNINDSNSIVCYSTLVNANRKEERELYSLKRYKFFITPNPDMQMVFLSYVLFEGITYPIGNVSFQSQSKNGNSWDSYFFTNRENTTTLQKFTNSKQAIVVMNRKQPNQVEFWMDCADQ